MSIIYSYPEQTALNDNDTLLGTSAALVGGKKKNITRNFSLSELNTYFGVGSIINPIASDFKLAVFNQGGTKITDSIISQDALAGTSVTIAGNLTANTTTLNGFLTVNGGANLGTGAAGELIAFGSTTRLNAPIQDQLGVVGTLDQILISDTAGRVSWQNYTSGLTYTGTWDATNNITAPQGNSLVSSVGTNGEFYIVTVAGNTQLNGQPVTPTTPPYWNVGDWVVFVENGGAGVWQKIDNTSVLTGTGTDNKIAMWTGGATPSVTLTDSLISQDAGATTVTVAGAFTSTGNINGVNITGAGDLSGVNLLLTGTVSLNAQLGNPGQVLTSQGTADAIWANPTPVNNITGSGTANTLSMFTGQYTVGDSAVTQSADALTVDVLTKTVSDASAYTINTNIGKLTRTGIFPGAGALTSNVTIGAQYTYGNVDMYGSQMELHTYNAPGYSGSPITLWSSSTTGIGISLRTDGGSITNLAGTYNIQATGAGSGASPEAIQISSNTGIKFEGQGNAANINFRSYNTNLNDSGDINFISETQEGQAGNVSFSSIATDANGTAGEIRLAGAGISTSATDAVPLGLVIASNGHVKTGSVGDTYTLGSSTDGSNVKLNLDAASGTDSAVTLTGAGGLTIAQTNDIVTLTAPAGSDTTYTLAAGVKSATSVPLNLTPSTGSGTAVNLTEGTGITLTQTSATEITISGSAQGVTSVTGTPNRISVTAGNTPVVDAVTSAVTSISTSLATGAQIQTAINAAVANVGAFQGAYDAATNTPDLDVSPSAAIQNGWFWAVTVAGTFFSENVQIGDFIFANQDNPGATFANWTVIQSGQDIAGSGTTDGATVKGVAGFNSNDFDVSVNGWVEAKDFSGSTPGYVPDATSATAGTFLKEDGTWSAIAPTAGVGSYTTGNGTILSPQTTSVQLAISAISASGTVFNFLNGLNLGDLVQITDGTVNGFFTYTAVGGGANGYRFAYVSGEIPTNFSTASNVINLRNANAGVVGDISGSGNGSSVTYFTGVVGDTGVKEITSNPNIVINSTGKLGIGTSSPAKTLHVDSGTTNEVARFQSTDGAAYLSIMDSSTVSSLQGIGSIGDSLVMYSNGADRMHIDASGNVGIGATAPIAKLDVNGDVNISGVTTSNAFRTDPNSSDFSLISRDSAGNSPLYVQSANASGNQLIAKFNYGSVVANSGSNVLTVAKDNSYFLNTSVGIGTTIPNAKLHVNASGTAKFIGTNADYIAGSTGSGVLISTGASTGNTYSQIYAFQSGNTAYADLVVPGGNVGIGANTPSVSLDLGSKTDAIQLPAGDNTARAAISNPFGGMIRYNTTDDQFEGYSGVGAAGSWGAIGGGGGASATITSNQTTTTNATTTVFALGATPNGSSVNFVDAFIDGVYQETTTYSVSGQNLTFNDPVPSGVTVETKTTADYNVGAVVTTASLGQTNTTGNVNLRIIPNYIISNITAQANNLYIFDSTTQAYTLTLPSSPQPGDSIKISIRGGLATNVLAVPATENIMGGVLGAPLTINNATAAFEIIYSGDSTKQGWVIIGNV
jgi:hypothetical protein